MNKKIITALIAVFALIVFCVMIFSQNRGKNMSEYKVQFNEVCAEHILVNSEAEANEILQEIKDEKISFEDAAKRSSKCPSGKNGGNLGYFAHGMMVKEFEDVAFSTEIGRISAPLKTQFGWHLIKVIDRK